MVTVPEGSEAPVFRSFVDHAAARAGAAMPFPRRRAIANANSIHIRVEQNRCIGPTPDGRASATSVWNLFGLFAMPAREPWSVGVHADVGRGRSERLHMAPIVRPRYTAASA